ncbi:MAG: biotin/lipoyl-containing protein, partial [Thermoleophilia bacterium]
GVVAPMPGRILRVVAAEGDVVARGTVVAILEAMKMENELRATGDGTVLRVAVKEGQNVSKGDLIVEVG